jgi:hypothetical protein
MPVWMAIWWMNRRDRRRWEPQEQLRDMEQVIREEAIPDEDREWWRQPRERQADINVWSHHWLNDATQEESETIGTFYVHWDPPMLDVIETDEGFGIEDLMQELGRVELNTLGGVKHGDVPHGEHTDDHAGLWHRFLRLDAGPGRGAAG